MSVQSSRSTTRDFEATASTLQALQDAQVTEHLAEIQDLDEDSVHEYQQDTPYTLNIIQQTLDAILR